MIDFSAVGAAAALFVAGLLSPGPNVMVIATASSRAGRMAGIVTGLGVALGDVLYACLALAGLSTVILASDFIFSAIRVAGGSYLIVLGLVMAWRARHPRTDEEIPAAGLSWFRRGLLTDLANAHTAVFFASAFAGTLGSDATIATRLAVVGAVAVVSLVWRIALATFFSAPTLRRSYERKRRYIEVVAGGIISITGARIALR